MLIWTFAIGVLITSYGDFRGHRSNLSIDGPRPQDGSTTPLTSHTHTHDMSVKASDVILILVAIIFPPAGAFFVTGCGCDLLINILLTW